MDFLTRLPVAFALLLLPLVATSEATPNVQTEQAAWVAPLEESTDALSQPRQPLQAGTGLLALVVMQVIFACIPLSVAVQMFSLCKLEGNLKVLARLSAYAMAALWFCVIVTGIAGSNLSPIWLAFLSPLFLLFLIALLIARSRFQRPDYSVSGPLNQTWS